MAGIENRRGERRSIRDTLRGWLRWAGGREGPLPPAVRQAEFRLTFSRFREILALNDGILCVISELEEKASGRVPFALPPVFDRLRQAQLDAALIVKNLNQIAGQGRYAALYAALGRIQEQIQAIAERQSPAPDGPLVLPFHEVRQASAPLAGSKAAALGELRDALGLAVPGGFVVTTSAFFRMLRASGQAAQAASLEAVFEKAGQAALAEACGRVRKAILHTPPPSEVVEAMSAARQASFGARRPALAVRSSAVGEDTAASHAGQYLTRLDVPYGDLPLAWREVVASAFHPDAVVYRYLRGLLLEQAAMAVLVLPMLRPRAAGVLFTRDANDPARDAMAIAVTGGRGDALVSGRTGAIELTLRDGEEIPAPPAGFIRPSDLAQLREAARRIEKLFGSPQDVEWAVEEDGPVYFLQSRPLALAPPPREEDRETGLADSGPSPLLEGGHVACPGIGIGPVLKLPASDLPDAVPVGSVLVARNALVELSRFLPSCAALVTEVGSPASHLAILSRECGVPALFGAGGAMERLAAGSQVTVDASRRRVFPGALPLKEARPDARGRVSGTAPLAGSPAVRRLRELAEWVVPLHLTDPTAPEFAPEHCRSLHDLTRFVHESVYRAMFGFAETVQNDLPARQVLDLRLPLAVHLFDVGGGLAAAGGAKVPPSAIRSEPMQAFVRGLSDPRIEWGRPRKVSAGGFLSVVGESMIGGPAEIQAMAETSFCVLSANYMNFAVRTGYHFSTIDTWCGRAETRNYVHFHFAGGGAGAERRERRQRFLVRVLEELRFQVRLRGDILTARFDKFDRPRTLDALERLGRLTLCARQLDMLMDSDAHAEEFANAFLAEDYSPF